MDTQTVLGTDGHIGCFTADLMPAGNAAWWQAAHGIHQELPL